MAGGEGVERVDAGAAAVRAEGTAQGGDRAPTAEVSSEGTHAAGADRVQVMRQGDAPGSPAPRPPGRLDAVGAQRGAEVSAIGVHGRAEGAARRVTEGRLERGIERDPPVPVAGARGVLLETRQPPRAPRDEVAQPVRPARGADGDGPALAPDVHPAQVGDSRKVRGREVGQSA